jgi:hypothetical protein
MSAGHSARQVFDLPEPIPLVASRITHQKVERLLAL